MSDPISQITTIATTAAVSGALDLEKTIISDFFSSIKEKYSKAVKDGSDNLVVYLEIGFKDFLIASYNKCKNFKTILNTNIPLDTFDQYIHATLNNKLEEIPDSDIISSISCKNPIVITGVAGCGKSMLMKYITIFKFKNQSSQIPLFTDLRKINPITDTNLLTFIRTSCSTASNTVSDSQFTKALERGMFIFILDGFDELNTEIRDKIQENIFEIRSKYPKNSLILSSRPDERFGSWNEFNIYSISKLTKEKCLNLINELPYDKGVKKRFYDKVKNELYDEYRDFLVYPLLVSIMLLTFEECAHIPNKITEFYNQAFDTLFYKHDALKEQYKRKFYTALTKDEFKLCFSAFCSIGYLNQKYAFTEELIKEYTEKSLNYSSTITPSMKNRSNVDNFIKDMTESVCLIQKDGLEYSFVHRSFQEYFTAIFISKTNNDNKVKLLNKFYKRKNDSVIPMAFELDRENIEKLWILPSLKSSLSELEDLIDNKKVEKYIESISVIVNVIEKEILFSINYNDNHISFIDTAEKLFSENKKNRKQNFLYQFFNEKSCIIFKENDLLKSENIINVKILKNIEETMKRFYSKNRANKKENLRVKSDVLCFHLNFAEFENDSWSEFFSVIGFFDFFDSKKLKSKSFIKDIEGRNKEKEDMDFDIFGNPAGDID